MKPLMTIAALVAVTLAVGVALAWPQTNDRMFVCDPIEYPDGGRGIAVVTVLEAGPIVQVEYYGPDNIAFLGRYEEPGCASPPADEQQAREFAFNHFFERTSPD